MLDRTISGKFSILNENKFILLKFQQDLSNEFKMDNFYLIGNHLFKVLIWVVIY